MSRYLILLLVAVFVSSCADEDNLNQPEELLAFDSDFYFDVNWHTSIGLGSEAQYVFLKPLILTSKIVTVSRDGRIDVLNKETGEIDNKIELDDTISAGVGGNEKTWLVATKNAYVVAIDGSNNTELWRVRVSSEVLARPLLYKDSVIVRTVDGKILSLNINNGETRWQYQRVIPDLTLRGSSEPVISRDKIFVGLADGRLTAISPDNGEVVWDIALAVPNGRSEIQRLIDIDGVAELYGRVLYAASFQGRVAAINVDRGQFLWARDFSTYSGIALDEKTLYSSGDNGHIWALDRLNGATIWKQEKLAFRKLTRPTVIGDYIAVGDFEGYVHLLSRYDGRFVARYQLGQFDHQGWNHSTGIIVPPIAITSTAGDDRLVVITRGGIIYTLEVHKRSDNI